MTRVLKWPLSLTSEDTILHLPSPHHIRLIAFQRGRLHAWIENGTGPAELFSLITRGTGEDHNELEHVGSAITEDGSFVVHVYRRWPTIQEGEELC